MRKWSFLSVWASCLIFVMALSLTMPIGTFASSAEKKPVKKVRSKKARLIRAKKIPNVKSAQLDEKYAPVEAAPAPVLAAVAPAKPTPKAEPVPTPTPKPKTEANAAAVSEKEKAEEKADELIRVKRRLAALEATVAGNAEDYKALKAKFDKTALDDPIRAETSWMTVWSVELQPNLEKAWYAACYQQKDNVACVNFSKLLIRNYPDTSYGKHAQAFIAQYVTMRQWDSFKAALDQFYSKEPYLKALEDLFAAGCPLSYMPYVTAQMALAGIKTGVMSESVLDVVKPYVERALQMYSPMEPPNGVMARDWEPLRNPVLAEGYKFLGDYALQKQQAPEIAIDYLTRSIGVKGHDGEGWKDPSNYYLRTSATMRLMDALNKKYKELPIEQRDSEAGKSLLAQIKQSKQSVIEDYARILALKERPEYQTLRTWAAEQVKMLLNGEANPAAALQELIKRFQAEFAA